MLEMLGSHIVKAIQRLNLSPVTPKPVPAAVNIPQAIIEHTQTEAAHEESSRRARISTERNEPPTHVVDQMGRGNFTTISKAITAAKNGDRILVRPGLYKEALVVKKVLEIIGEGSVEDIVVEARSKTVLSFQAAFGRVVNLTLRQTGGEDYYSVDMWQGRLDLEGCDISSQSHCCVGIQGSADPRLRRNRIHNGKLGGVFIFDNGQGTLEDNDIFNNASAGVRIFAGGNPTLRRNRIHENKTSGVEIIYDGQGTLEDNDIFSNALHGVEITAGSDPVLLRNRIHNNAGNGIYVSDKGHGIVEDNDVFSNGWNGITTTDNSNPVVKSNRINKNQGYAVAVVLQGGGVFEDNDLSYNVRGAWHTSEDSKPNLTQERNTK
jgi:parallel beta-helix repeat protein